MTSSRLTYRFGPLERRGILGPVRLGQAAILGAGALLAIAVLDRAPSAGGALMATIAFGIAVAVAVAPIGSRTVEEWCPIVAAFGVRRLTRRNAFRSPVPTRGFRVRRGAIGSLEPALPVALRGVRIVEAGYRDQDNRAARGGGAAADQRGRVPRCVVLATRPRGAGAAPDSLGPRALGGGRHGDQADPVDRADGAGAGRRTRALVARGAGSSGAAAWDADDRVLPGADRNDCQGRAGARDPDCGSGRRPARTRSAEPMPSERPRSWRPSASPRPSAPPR